MKNFQGKKVVVTGGASGLGRLLARAFARRGSVVVIADLDEHGAGQAAREIRADGGEAHAYRVDLTRPADIAAFHQRVRKDVGRIDILVNNAGVVFGGAFETVPLEKHLVTYAVNTSGLMAMTHTFFGDLLEADEGHLVNIASASGYIGLPYGATYASSKWAVIGFSDSIRLELEERGFDNVGVTTVCPGYISTRMFDGVKAPLLVPFLAPDKVVARILRAVEHNEVTVREPFMVKTVDLLRAGLPQRVWDRAAHYLGISSSMMHWKGHGR